MDYFSNLPTIDYYFIDVDQYVKIKNIFYKLNLDVNSELIKFYRIDEIKRIDTISFELYETVDYWWILCLLNNIHDLIFDLPVENEILQSIANRKTLEIYSAITDPGALDYYSEILNELILENDEKRKIWIVEPLYINEVISRIIRLL